MSVTEFSLQKVVMLAIGNITPVKKSSVVT